MYTESGKKSKSGKKNRRTRRSGDFHLVLVRCQRKGKKDGNSEYTQCVVAGCPSKQADKAWKTGTCARVEGPMDSQRAVATAFRTHARSQRRRTRSRRLCARKVWTFESAACVAGTYWDLLGRSWDVAGPYLSYPKICTHPGVRPYPLAPCLANNCDGQGRSP